MTRDAGRRSKALLRAVAICLLFLEQPMHSQTIPLKAAETKRPAKTPVTDRDQFESGDHRYAMFVSEVHFPTFANFPFLCRSPVAQSQIQRYRGARIRRERILSISPSDSRQLSTVSLAISYLLLPAARIIRLSILALLLRPSSTQRQPRFERRTHFARLSRAGTSSRIPNWTNSAIIFEAACWVTSIRLASSVIVRSPSIRCWMT